MLLHKIDAQKAMLHTNISTAELVLFRTDKIAMTWTSATKGLTHTQGVWCT